MSNRDIENFFINKCEQIRKLVESSNEFKEYFHDELVDAMNEFSVKKVIMAESNQRSVSYEICERLGVSKFYASLKKAPRSIFKKETGNGDDLISLSSIEIGLTEFNIKPEIDKLCEEFSIDLQACEDVFYRCSIGDDFVMDSYNLIYRPSFKSLNLYVNIEDFEQYLINFVYPIMKRKSA